MNLTATGASGNKNSTYFYVNVTDTIPPIISSPSVSPNIFGIATPKTATISATVSDAGSGVASVTAQIIDSGNSIVKTASLANIGDPEAAEACDSQV